MSYNKNMPFNPNATKRLRENLGMTQREFGKLIGTPQTTIWKWESKGEAPTGKKIEKMFDLSYEYNIEIDFFIPPAKKNRKTA